MRQTRLVSWQRSDLFFVCAKNTFENRAIVLCCILKLKSELFVTFFKHNTTNHEFSRPNEDIRWTARKTLLTTDSESTFPLRIILHWLPFCSCTAIQFSLLFLITFGTRRNANWMFCKYVSSYGAKNFCAVSGRKRPERTLWWWNVNSLAGSTCASSTTVFKTISKRTLDNDSK